MQGASVESIAKLTERAAIFVLLLGGIGMLMSMFLGVADIVGTQVLAIPVPGPREITESTMVLIVFGALAYTQVRRAHIRVELVYDRCGPRSRAVMDVATDVAAIAFYSLIFWQAVIEAQFSYQTGEATFGAVRFPLLPARLFLVVGVGLMILRLILDLITDLSRVKTGAPPPVSGPEISSPELRN
jgi:TRAP-type C4-dicarboxylate transport system permease small subunit